MTLERGGAGTGRFFAPSLGAAADVFGLANPAQAAPLQGPLSGPQFEFFPAGRDKSIVGWRLTISDLRQGLNRTRGYYNQTFGRTKQGTLDSRQENELVLPQEMVVQATPAPSTITTMVDGVNVFGTLAMVAGYRPSAGYQDTLFKETSATDPTVVGLTFDPGADEGPLHCFAVVMAGYLAEPKLVVTLGGAGAKVFSDLAATPTVAGTMHADTAFCTGMIQTFLNDNTILIYTQGAIGTLTASDAIATQPTYVLDDVPVGGWSLGLLSLGGGPVRAWWVWPRYNTILNKANTLIADCRQSITRVISTNLEGGDPQELKLTELPFITAADIIRDGIVATDSQSVVFHNGRTVEKLRWDVDRPADSDRHKRIQGIWVRGDELYVDVVETPSEGGAGDYLNWRERFDWDLRAWFPASEVQLMSDEDISTVSAGHSMPVSHNTGFLHHTVRFSDSPFTTSWQRQFQPKAGRSPFSLRQTTGAQSGTGAEFAFSGFWDSPSWILPPPIEYAPKVVDRIYFGGDIDAGGTGALVRVTAGGVSWLFKQPINERSRIHEFASNQHRFFTLDVRIAADRESGNDRVTPQCLPITIEGRAFLDEVKAGTHLPW